MGCLSGAYRSTPHESTLLTPNMMMLGREVRYPLKIELSSKTLDHISERENVTSMREKVYLAHQVARQHLEKTAKMI